MAGGTKKSKKRIYLIAGAAVLAAFAFAVWFSGRGPAGTRPPNVLLISLDTTRRDHLSCYGYGRTTTPRIDEVAQDALLFTRAVAVSNWTLPTHASMLTGLYPQSHGAHHVPRSEPHVEHVDPAGRLGRDCATLAEILLEQGYRTGAVLGNFWWLGRPYGLDRGFEEYDHRPGPPPTHYRRAEVITDLALEWLDREDPRPFFLFLNYMDPHIPYAPPAPFDSRFNDPPAAAPPGFSSFYRTQSVVNRNRMPLPAQTRQWFVNMYDGEIAYMDAQVGRVIDWLRERGSYDDTMIVITSDHGEAFDEHFVSGHGFALYEDELGAAMILKLPHSEERGKRDHLVQHVDILPTVLESISVPLPGATQGLSMLKASRREAMAVEFVRETNTRIHPRFARDQWALYSGSLKYLEYSDGERELFDLVLDPAESTDLIDARPEDADRLRAELAAWRERAVAPREDSPEQSETDPETLERLRGLGYVE